MILDICFEKCKIHLNKTIEEKFKNIVSTYLKISEAGGYVKKGSEGVYAVISVPKGYVNPYENDLKPNTELVNAIIDVSELLYHILKPEMVYAEYDWALDEFLPKKTPIFWLTILNSKRVKELGKEKILFSPAYKVIELNDGAILIVLSNDPLTCGYDIRNKVGKHIFGKEWKNLRGETSEKKK